MTSTSHGRLRKKNRFMTFRENPAHAQAVDARPSPRKWGLGTRLMSVAYPGGCFGCSSTPLDDRIHSFVSAMAQDCIYAKVAPPTSLERKRFGYKQHANCSTAGGRAKMLHPLVRYAMPFFRAATPLVRLRPLQGTRGRWNYAI